MATTHVTKTLGLVSQFNPLSIQDGSLRVANNCVNYRENVYEDRRGYKVHSTLANFAKSVHTFNYNVIVHNGLLLSRLTSGSFVDYPGTYTEVTGAKMRSVEAASNLYFTTNKGVQVLQDNTTAARTIGAPRALDLEFSLTGATGFLSTNSQCAYRFNIQRIDLNKNVLNGYPSQRLWVVNSNPAGRNVILTTYIPSSCVVGDVIQVYRTDIIAGVSGDISGDDMYLVYRHTLKAADITAGYMTFTDSVNDELKGETLYTSPSQQGISQANAEPPLCKDIALYRSSFLMFANTETKQRLFSSIVSTSNLSGNSIILGGVTYNFGATENVGTNTAKVSATGVVAVDIDETAKSLVRVINRSASNTTLYAYYLSGADDLPGQIMFESRTVGTSAFTIQASASGMTASFSPEIPLTPATSSVCTSSNSVQKNALFFSKYQELEAVPLLNYLLIGSANKEILRIKPLRESLIIIKEEGVFRLTGEDVGSFTVTPIDLTVFCKSEDSVSVLSNEVFMLTNQGIVSISENGIQVVSREIEPNLKPLLQKSNLSAVTFGLGYESDRHYLLSTISDKSETVQNQVLVFNVFNRTWTRWTLPMSGGVIEQGADKMFFIKPNDQKVYVERKDFQDSDFADPEYSINIDSISDKSVRITSASVIPQIGWAIEQGSSQLVIEAIINNGSTYDVSFSSEVPSSWVTGAALLYPSVGFEIEWNPWTAGQPALMKQIRFAKLLTDNTNRNNTATIIDMTFKTNFDEDQEKVRIFQSADSWGRSPWGNFAWGGGSESYGYPCIVPRNKQYSTRMSLGCIHNTALEKLSIVGCAYDYEISSDRIGR